MSWGFSECMLFVYLGGRCDFWKYNLTGNWRKLSVAMELLFPVSSVTAIVPISLQQICHLPLHYLRLLHFDGFEICSWKEHSTPWFIYQGKKTDRDVVHCDTGIFADVATVYYMLFSFDHFCQLSLPA